MIMKEMIEYIRYPNEKTLSFDSRIDYYDVVEGLKIGLKNAKGQLKTDMQDTLSELELRWKERQKQSERQNISAENDGISLRISSTV